MINLKGKDSVADAVKSILQQEEGSCVTTDKAKKIAKKEVHKHEDKMHKEEIDSNYRTKDMIGGRGKTDHKDDVGPSGDFKSTKVKFRAGPSADTDDFKPYPEKGEPETKQLSPVSYVKTAKPLPRDAEDVRAKEGRMKQGMKEEAESLEEKNWIAGAIKKPGAMKAAAKREGESTSEYIKKHEHDSGKAGKRARLAKTLKSFKEELEENSIYDQLINEVLSKDASAGDWIHDFIHSDNPKFKGKSKEMRKKMALAAYYAKQRNEETESVEEGVVDTIKKGVKKAAEVLGGPDDEGHKKDLQRKMGIPQTGKQGHAKQNEEWNKEDAVKRLKDLHKREKEEEKADKKMMQDRKKQNEEVEQIDELKKSTLGSYIKKASKDTAVHGFAIGDSIANKKWSTGAKAGDMADKRIKGISKATDRLTKEETVEEGWDDMLKDVKAKKGPQPSGGSGVKQGSRYGGGKQKDKPEHDDEKKVNEAEHHTPMSKAKQLAHLAMKKIKKDMSGKKAK
jgi:hypothetical protein